MASKSKTRPDKLAEYRRKRSPDRTLEPFPGEALLRPGLFVVQKHAARAMHYDLRLEMEGALQSWAVPKGPSLDPQVKRLAMHVEEHPIEYAEFEGLIPDGEYGAGAVIVWDRGRWESVGDPVEGLKKGKLLFDLYGFKLRGRWTLFRTSKGKPNEWLLMKKPDAEANAEAQAAEQSIKSGLTVEELRDGADPSRKIRNTIRRLQAPQGEPDFDTMKPMLARTAEQPFTDKAWLFELKYDGFRLLGRRGENEVRLRYRSGGEATATFPEIAGALSALPYDGLIVDGEVVVLDDLGRPSFQRLQQRVQLRRPDDIARATVQRPATWFLFDLLAFEDHDLRGLPLEQRKKLLRQVLPPHGPLRYCDHIGERGEQMYDAVREMRLEGIVAKKRESIYVEARSPSWLKIRVDRTSDFVVVGWSPAKGSRSGFGALHLADYEGDELVYAGRVGSGFTDDQLEGLHGQLHPTVRDSAPCKGELPRGSGHEWVEPSLVAEVRYKERTAIGQLRHPVFLRLREDKSPEECERDDVPVAREPDELPQPSPAKKSISFTNLDKLFWPAEGYTKGDLIEYYGAVSDWLRPYLEDRPLVLTRYPDGIEGKSFFQKDAPAWVPEWIRTQKMWSEHAKREIHYFIADDTETLLYLANMATIPLHLWSSRMTSLQQPDWCILDLDPKEAPFEHVVRVARAARSLCTEIGLECFVKTSGSTGLHVLLPLGRQVSYEQSRTLGHVLARAIVSRLPEIATIARATAARGGRVYVDYLQNGHGRLLVAPYCVRPLPGAPVSAPLRWSEVRQGLDIRKFTIKTLPRRLARQKRDPLLDVLELKPDLSAVLERLAELL